MSTETWMEMFKKETVDIAKMDVNALTYVESASRMRQLLKTGSHYKNYSIVGTSNNSLS